MYKLWILIYFIDVPDDFYDVTKDDLQKMIRHLREQM